MIGMDMLQNNCSRTLEDRPVRNPEEKWQMEANATRLLQIQFRCYNVRR
jgi:hypothetical protein